VFDTERPILAIVALAAGLVALIPGFLVGTWAVLLIPTAVALIESGALLGLGLLLAALLAGLALPVAAIWLGSLTRRASQLGRAGWLLGWLALGLVILSGVLLYTVAPGYFRA
jgi:hypothetical protein